MVEITNTIALHVWVMWIALLLLQKGSYKVQGVRLHPSTFSPECDHCYWVSFRFLVQVGQQMQQEGKKYL